MTLLERYRQNNPPVLISDGFPGDYLPQILLPRSTTPAGKPKEERIAHYRRLKDSGRSQWVALEVFDSLRQGELPLGITPSVNSLQLIRPNITQKNTIDRATNTAGGDAGDLFEMEEIVIPEVTFYWRIEENYESVVRDFLADLAAAGYGKRKSIGYGHIERWSLESFDGFASVPDADGFVTLSRFVPAPANPREGYWNTVVKYGKLGEEFAVGGNPFKKPLIQLDCGSCFRDSVPADWVNAWYGRMVEDISPANPQVIQYGLAFLLPMKFPQI